MKIQLINSLGLDLETFEGDEDAVCMKIGEWIGTISEGDTIKFLEVAEELV